MASHLGWRFIFILLVLIGAVAHVVTRPIRLGLDLRGGTQIVLEAKDTARQRVNDDTVDRTLEVLRRRVDQGVANLQRAGARRIIVELPGVADPEEAVEVIGQTAQLEFRPVLEIREPSETTATTAVDGDDELLLTDEEGFRSCRPLSLELLQGARRRESFERSVAEFERVEALLRQGYNDCQIARITGIPRGTIRDWRRKPNCGPQNPQYRGGNPNAKCPIFGGGELDASVYAYLLGMYLGDGYINRMPKKRVYRLRITMDLAYPSIVEECCEAIRHFCIGGEFKVGVVPAEGCVVASAYWNHWPCVFPYHGPGRKHERPIILEDWQVRIVKSHPDRLLRGFIHSDGSRTLNRVKGKVYPRYEFVNASSDIRKIFADTCDDLGIFWRPMKERTIVVARRKHVARLDEVISPKT